MKSKWLQVRLNVLLRSDVVTGELIKAFERRPTQICFLGLLYLDSRIEMGLRRLTLRDEGEADENNSLMLSW